MIIKINSENESKAFQKLLEGLENRLADEFYISVSADGQKLQAIGSGW